jgi:hypothetical protein
VTVGQCSLPAVATIAAVVQPDGSWILKPDIEARRPRTFSWVRLSDNAVVGSDETLAVGVLSSTTSYRLTVTDACGTATGNVTVTVPLPITTGLLATAAFSPQLQISVTWPAIAGATAYTVQRRSGPVWSNVATVPSPGFLDQTVAAGYTYAYRALSNNGGSTDVDVATTTLFTAAVLGQSVTTIPTNDMLNAVNKVRAAVGWPALTWSNILAASDPVPAPTVLVMGRHITSCRARMNEALQALGVTVHPYTDADPLGKVITATSINEVQDRAK